MTFDELLAENPQLQRVGFYHLTCKSHGVFRLIANGVVPDSCPRCGEPARLARSRMRVATSKPVPLVQRWKSDNLSAVYNAAPSRMGGIEDC